MSIAIGGRSRRATAALAATALALAASLVASSAAVAGPDQLSGGSVVLQPSRSHGFTLKPKSVTVPITGGDLDPTNGAGTVETSGGFRAKRGGHTAKVKIRSLSFGANGGVGRIDAKVGKRRVKGFGKLSGGTVTRDGWGAKLNGVTAKLGSKGARALTRALSPGQGARASAAGGGIKAGQALGTVSVNAVPRTVEVLPGGTLVFEADLGFGMKLAAHCINALFPDGVTAIAPGVQSGVGGTDFTFPVTGGSIAPDLSTGRVTSAGGQKIRKNDGLPAPNSCDEGPPVGTTITQTAFEAQFDIRALASDTVLPYGPVGISALGPFDLAAAATSVDVNTKQITVNQAPVTLDYLSAFVLNQVFPNASGDPSNDFQESDLLGTMSLSITTH
jgi:hypothetical protein